MGGLPYKRRSSVVYNAEMNFLVENVFNGVFFKQNGYLVLSYVGSTMSDLTFHVLATRHVYDTSLKPGLQLTIGLFGGFGPRAAHMFLKRIPDNESILKHARNQGIVEMKDLPRGFAHILEGNDIDGVGTLEL